MTAVDDSIRQLVADMLETMYAAPGVGLSAIQVAVPRRIIIVDPAKDPDPPAPFALINPEIIWRSDDVVCTEEGCLSFPEQFAEVVRPAAIEVAYLDLDGEPRTRKAEGLLARCLQHEMDHLDGIVFVEHLSAIKRGIIMRKMIKAKRLATAEV